MVNKLENSCDFIHFQCFNSHFNKALKYVGLQKHLLLWLCFFKSFSIDRKVSVVYISHDIYWVTKTLNLFLHWPLCCISEPMVPHDF